MFPKREAIVRGFKVWSDVHKKRCGRLSDNVSDKQPFLGYSSAQLDRVMKFLDKKRNTVVQVGMANGISSERGSELLKVIWSIEISPSDIVEDDKDSIYYKKDMWSKTTERIDETLRLQTSGENQLLSPKRIPGIERNSITSAAQRHLPLPTSNSSGPNTHRFKSTPVISHADINTLLNSYLTPILMIYSALPQAYQVSHGNNWYLKLPQSTRDVHISHAATLSPSLS